MPDTGDRVEDRLALHARRLDPPQHERGHAHAQQLGERLELALGDGAGASVPDQPGQHRARLRVDLDPEGADLLAAARVAEQHPPRVVVRLDVVQPDLEHRAQALLQRALGRDRAGEGPEVLAVALEQRQVERRLVGEVPVEHRLR